MQSLPDLDRRSKYTAAAQLPRHIPVQVYFDQAADRECCNAFYAGVSEDPKQRYAELSALLKANHRVHPGHPTDAYDAVVKESLYTNVDRRPDGVVRCIYAQAPVNPVSFPKISWQTLDKTDLASIAGISSFSPEVVAAWMCCKASTPRLNCDHAVPQHLFRRREPMKSDLHQLFACERDLNSKRGNKLFGDFEPPAGKGKVARATLYFMLRYPQIKLPYSKQQFEVLKEWSASEPPDLHERHRNQEIHKLQGTRNPFVDHPDWVAQFPAQQFKQGQTHCWKASSIRRGIRMSVAAPAASATDSRHPRSSRPIRHRVPTPSHPPPEPAIAGT